MIATKIPFPKVTENQLAELGIVLAVQVIPSGEVAAAVDEPVDTATNTPFPYATELQLAELGNVLPVHAEPLDVIEMLTVAVVLPAELDAVIV